MALVNRDKDVSEQKDVYSLQLSGGLTTVATGATAWIGLMPYPGVIQSMKVAAAGLSGAPLVSLQTLRFAAGGTTIAVSISGLVCSEFGTSGMIGTGFSGLAAAGSTLLSVQAGDILQIQTGGANTAARNMIVEVVVKKTQDYVSYNGISS